MYSFICISRYIEINKVTYISNWSDAQLLSLCLSNKPDSHISANITFSAHLSHHHECARPLVPHARALVLICTRQFCFETTEEPRGMLKQDWLASGVRQVVRFHVYSNLHQKLAVKAKTERGIFCYFAMAKLLQKEK